MRRPPRSWNLSTGLLGRLALIGLILFFLLAAFGYVGGWLDPGRLTPRRMVEALERNSGPQPGFRRNHAKGLCVVGHFEGNGQGARLSHASVFETGQVPVVGRFAIGGGVPHAPDGGARVRSLALSFTLDDGQQWRTAMNSAPVLGVATPQAFYEQTLAARPDPTTGKPDPEKLKAFQAAHPETAPFLEWARTAPWTSSFANTAYYGINAFRFVNAQGHRRFVRWSMEPETPLETLDKAALSRLDSDFLSADLLARLGRGALRWKLIVTLAAEGDPTNDATRRWPEERERVDVGTLVIERAERQEDGPCRDINFDPLVLPSGIEPSEDPLLSARSAAYAESYHRRIRETGGVR
jgi:catalase